MKQFRKAVLATLVLITLLSSSILAFGATRWTNIAMISGDMDIISPNMAKVWVDASGESHNGMNRIKVKCELQKKNGSWKTIKTWSEVFNDIMISYTKEYPVETGYEYRLKLTVYAYNNNTLLEQVTEFFDYGYY